MGVAGFVGAFIVPAAVGCTFVADKAADEAAVGVAGAKVAGGEVAAADEAASCVVGRSWKDENPDIMDDWTSWRLMMGRLMVKAGL